MEKNLTKGILFVALGATSYGMLATIVKLAYKEGFSTAEVTASQFAFGIIILLLIHLFSKKSKDQNVKRHKKFNAGGNIDGINKCFVLFMRQIY